MSAPDYDTYPDTGCDICPSCLCCMLPRCRYDLPPKVAGALIREAQLRELMNAGHSADECAVLMGVARRTIFRLRHFTATNSLLVLTEGRG